MRSTWLGLAFTRFRYLTDFQENNECNSCFVTISFSAINSVPPNKFIYQIIYKWNNAVWTTDDLIVSANKVSLLIKMSKWHAHVIHMAKHVNMVLDPVLELHMFIGLLSIYTCSWVERQFFLCKSLDMSSEVTDDQEEMNNFFQQNELMESRCLAIAQAALLCSMKSGFKIRWANGQRTPFLPLVFFIDLPWQVKSFQNT